MVATALAALASSLLLPAPVTALGHTAGEVAVASGCEVRVWSPPARRATLVGRNRCDRTSTGSGIAAVAIAGHRVLWLHYTGGNIREWSLYTATTRRRTARLLRSASADVDGRAPIVVGDGFSSPAGDGLPYAVGRSVVVLRANGARRFAWEAPAPVVALGSRGGLVAVAWVGGGVTVLDGAGRMVEQRSFTGEIDAVVPAGGSDVVIQQGRTLLLAFGSSRRLGLAAGARLQDFDADRAFVASRGRIVAISSYDGTTTTIGPGEFVRSSDLSVAIASGKRVTVRTLAPLPHG